MSETRCQEAASKEYNSRPYSGVNAENSKDLSRTVRSCGSDPSSPGLISASKETFEPSNENSSFPLSMFPVTKYILLSNKVIYSGEKIFSPVSESATGDIVEPSNTNIARPRIGVSALKYNFPWNSRNPDGFDPA